MIDAPGTPIGTGMRRLTPDEERARIPDARDVAELTRILDAHDRVRNRGAVEIRSRYFTR